MRWIPVGKVPRTHGLKGELKFFPYDAGESIIRSLKNVKLGDGREADKEWQVESLRGKHSRRIIKFKGLDSIEAAQPLAGQTVHIRQGDFEKLPEGEYYWFEIEGLKAYDDAGKYYGMVEEIILTGSNDVYVVRDGDRELLLPMIESVIHTIDLAEGKLIFHIVEGLIENDSV